MVSWTAEVSFGAAKRWYGPYKTTVRGHRASVAVRRAVLAAKDWRRHDVVPEGVKIYTVVVKVSRVRVKAGVGADPRQEVLL